MKNTTHIIIQAKATLADIQQQFNEIFRFLKIEFFTEPHVTGASTPKNKMLSSDLSVSQVMKTKKEGKIQISGSTKVKDLEEKFKQEFGLNVQVFRKSGNVWLETSVTDKWTLERQNEEGKSLATQLEKESLEEYDDQ